MITSVTPRTARSPKRRIANIAAAAIAAGALALSACSSGSPAPGGTEAAAEPELTKMVAVTFLPLESFTFTPEMFASAGGYFEKHGLDVQLQPVQGTSAAIQTLLGGATPITRASTVDVFPAMEQGQPIVAIGTMAYKSNLRVASAEGNPIESPADMEDQVMGMGSIGGTSEKMLNLALDGSDIPRESVTRQAVPVTGATFELVKQEQLAGYIVSLDTSIAIGDQNPDAVISPAGLGDAPDLQTWITTKANLENPERVEEIQAFLAAIKEATQFVIDDQENDFENVLQILRDSGQFAFAALDDDAVAKEALEVYVTQTWVDAEGEIPLLENDMDAWTAAYETYAKSGLLDGGQDPTQWITNDYLPAD